MRVLATKPTMAPASILPGATFIDAFGVPLEAGVIDARTAAERMFGRSPSWVTHLMAARNTIMRPFGVKTPKPTSTGGSVVAIGMFPIISETAGRMILGFDDRHLDFRVVVDVDQTGDACSVTTTTIVRTNNLLGRLYLSAIMPFHRQVVKDMLRQVNEVSPSGPGANRV